MFTFTDTDVTKIEKAYFESINPLKLRLFPPKQKKKYICLQIIMTQVEDRYYTEKEINEVLKNIYSDYVTLRRALIDYGFMKRTLDGKQYWITKKT